MLDCCRFFPCSLPALSFGSNMARGDKGKNCSFQYDCFDFPFGFLGKNSCSLLLYWLMKFYRSVTLWSIAKLKINEILNWKITVNSFLSQFSHLFNFYCIIGGPLTRGPCFVLFLDPLFPIEQSFDGSLDSLRSVYFASAIPSATQATLWRTLS